MHVPSEFSIHRPLTQCRTWLKEVTNQVKLKYKNSMIEPGLRKYRFINACRLIEYRFADILNIDCIYYQSQEAVFFNYIILIMRPLVVFTLGCNLLFLLV